MDGSSFYQKWYFEVVIDHIEQVTHMLPHLRIGWANSLGYVTYPGGGEAWGGKNCDFLFLLFFHNQFTKILFKEMEWGTICIVLDLMV